MAFGPFRRHPSIGQRLAEQLLAEMGPEMRSFPIAAHLAS
jgi:hypothetical protein